LIIEQIDYWKIEI